MEELLQAQLNAQRAGVSYAVVTIAEASGSVPRTSGKMLVYADGHSLGTIGGGPAERRAKADALAQLDAGQNAFLHYDFPTPGGASCAGRLSILIEVFQPKPLLVVFGGGHVAQALVPVLAAAEFRCVVLEDRPEFADKAHFPAAAQVRLYPAGAPDAPLTGQDFVCIMTHGHHADLECEAFALRSPARYIGVMGSRRKTESVNARLRAMGFGEADFRRVHTPIGLAIGAQTPGEIAVSIAAELIAVRAGKL